MDIPSTLRFVMPRGTLLGGCGFEGLAYGHKAEIGYWVAKPFWGQGIATAVIRTAREFAIAKWDLVAH